MLAFILLFLFFYFVFNSFSKHKAYRTRRPCTLDTELKQLIKESNNTIAIGSDNKCLFLDVINDAANDLEKFSDTRMHQAKLIFDRAGPASFYLITEIAAQLSILAAAIINGIPANMGVELGEGATPGMW